MRRFILLIFVMLTAVSGTTAVTASEPQSPPAAGTDWRFGVIESFEAPGEASALGASWTRVQFHWAETQPNNAGEWLSKVSDAQINGEINAGRMVTGLLIGIPGWAQDENGLPRGLWLPHDDPNNTWAVFVRDVASRYQGRIDHWVIWNEPDISAGAVAHTWNGSVRDFFQLQRTAYLAAKETNPNAVIHLAAFTYFWDPGYFNRFLDEVVADPAAADHNYYFDVATAHLYFQPNSIYDIIQSFYGAMGGHGLWKPIWLMETNAPPINDPDWPVPNWTLSVTLDEQAAFMPQMMASALAAGAERIAVFKLKDAGDDRAANPEPFGLISMNGRRRPAFTTYQVGMRYLAGMTGVSRERWNEVGQIRIEQGEQTTTVVFARLPAPQQAQVAAAANTAVLVDMWGTRRTVTAVDGLFTIDLPGALCSQSIGDYCMIGGTAYYLIQAADGSLPEAPPGPAPAAPPAPTTTSETTTAATLEPTPLPTDDPTPEPSSTATATNTTAPTHTPSPTNMAVPTATDTTVPTDRPTAGPTTNPTHMAPSQPATDNREVAHQPPATGYWFIGGAFLVALGLGGWWWRNGRHQ